MQVSFIIPLFNCLALTRAMLASLQRTLPRNLSHEIILVDDGSTDGTREWLATLKAPFRVIINERNLGYAGANNRGALEAHGDKLVLLNNDLILTPCWLEPMLAVHDQLRSPGVIGNVQYNARTGALDHVGIIFNHKGKPEHDTSSFLPAAIYPGYRKVPAVTGACMLISRDLWQQLGGFDENYINGGEDINLCFLAKASGHTNAVALRSKVRHHISMSPGRKLHDEANAQRMTKRWHAEIAVLSAPAWCLNFLEIEWGRTLHPHDYSKSMQALTYYLGLRQDAPAFVRAGIEDAINQEIARWERMFRQ